MHISDKAGDTMDRFLKMPTREGRAPHPSTGTSFPLKAEVSMRGQQTCVSAATAF